MANNNIVNDTLNLLTDYRSKADAWRSKARENQLFRLGEQWTSEQKNLAESRGLATIVVNRIHPAVESAKAMMTARRPSFRVAPREDSDNKVANILSGLLAYIYDKSDGTLQTRQAIDDYYVAGLGYLVIDYDKTRDKGKGEVILCNESPLDVFVDPSSKDRLFDDAENILVVKRLTKKQVEKYFPDKLSQIHQASGEDAAYEPSTDLANTTGDVFFSGDVGDLSGEEYIHLIDRYTKKRIKEFEVFEPFTGNERRYNEAEYKDYIAEVVYMVGDIQEGHIFTSASEAEMAANTLTQMAADEYNQVVDESVSKGALISEIPPPKVYEVQQITRQLLIEYGIIKSLEFEVTKIHRYRVLGNTIIAENEIPGYRYPIVPIIANHTRTPYPTADVALAKGLQQYINKVKSVSIAHSQTSTNLKVLLPEGSVDMDDFEEKWGRPGVGIEVDFAEGSPVIASPTPLPNELFVGEQNAKNDINHLLGLYELSMGNAQAAPETHKATMAIDEFGQRNIRSKLLDIEGALSRVGEVAIAYIQKYYTAEKTFRIIQPNNSIDEYVINKRLVDDKTEEIQILNNVSIGSYDVVAVAGSTLPTNRYAELELHMDAYQQGIIDKVEVLKKSEIYDAEGVLQRTDTIAQLQANVEQLSEENKRLKGDLQTRDRESVNMRKRVEVEKFKADLDMIKNRIDASEGLFSSRLDDILSQINKLATPKKESKNDKE